MRRAFTRSAAILSALVIAVVSASSSSSSAASRIEGIERARLENRIKDDREDFAGSASAVMRSNLRESMWKAAAVTTEPHRIRYLFQSHFWDGDVGLYHMRARMFDPRSGTFLSRDPSGYVDSVNLYAPMKWDVVNRRDPTGEKSFEDCQAERRGGGSDLEFLDCMFGKDISDERAAELMALLEGRGFSDWQPGREYSGPRSDWESWNAWEDLRRWFKGQQYNEAVMAMPAAGPTLPYLAGLLGASRELRAAWARSAAPDAALESTASGDRGLRAGGAQGGRTIPPGLGSTVSQKQMRHVKGRPEWTARGEGSYFMKVEEAQAVLDAVHQGTARVLGTTAQGHLVVEVKSVVGFNNNPGAGFRDQPTHVFIIKGTANPSVVPTSPERSFGGRR